MGLGRLLLLSTLMLSSTLIASFLPLYLDLSPRKLQLVSTYSTGLLVGAALTVVIPEGVKAVFESSGDDGGGVEGWIGASLLAGFILMYMIHNLTPQDSDDSHCSHPHSHSHSHSRTRPRQPHSHPSLRHMPSHLSELEPLSPPRTSTDSQDPPRTSSTSDDPTTTDWTIPMNDPSPSSYRREPQPSSSSSSALSTLIGLLLHSLSDGISLGASTLSSSSPSHSHSHADPPNSSSLSTVIFLAIMLHKAPTAFALSSLLTSSTPPSSRSFIRRGLVLFSLSAPLGAIFTYLILKLVGSGGEGAGGEVLEWYTGIALVFSGGTFLFVATHAVTDEHDQNDEDDGTSGKSGGEGIGEAGRREKVGKRLKVALVLVGMVTPGILSRLVGHGH